MEKSVGGIRETFYRDIIREYYAVREKSFLYKAFWTENVTEILKKHFPQLLTEEPPQPKDEPRLRRLMKEAMEERTEWAKGLLLKEPPREGRLERRNFWEELWLNDAGYQAKLISDEEYYLWLVEYLAARDIYYKDKSIWDGQEWRDALLSKGLGNRGNASEPGLLPDGGKNTRTNRDMRRDLRELAERMRKERNAGETEIVERLRRLSRFEENRKGERRRVDSLLWLTRRMKWMALHTKIKNGLQDNGVPIGVSGETKKTQKKPRKQDFSMRLFETYCDSDKGYHFYKKDSGGVKSSGNWTIESSGFCASDPDQAEALRAAMEQSGKTEFYFPLAVDLFSGCVLFLAGKGNYRELYEKAGEKLKDAYNQKKECCCFDYLRLDEKYLDPRQCPWDVGGAFRLTPAFLRNAGKSYLTVLSDFKRYCERMNEDDIPHFPRYTVREYNEKKPDDAPDPFRLAFDDSYE